MNMKKSLSILLFTTCLLLVACGKSFSDVKIGMTEQEVTDMLGKPNRSKSSSSSSSFNEEVTSATSEAEWEYNGQGKLSFENGKVVKIQSE